MRTDGTFPDPGDCDRHLIGEDDGERQPLRDTMRERRSRNTSARVHLMILLCLDRDIALPSPTLAKVGDGVPTATLDMLEQVLDITKLSAG